MTQTKIITSPTDALKHMDAMIDDGRRINRTVQKMSTHTYDTWVIRKCLFEIMRTQRAIETHGFEGCEVQSLYSKADASYQQIGRVADMYGI